MRLVCILTTYARVCTQCFQDAERRTTETKWGTDCLQESTRRLWAAEG